VNDAPIHEYLILGLDGANVHVVVAENVGVDLVAQLGWESKETRVRVLLASMLRISEHVGTSRT
jgi:hypothetical protein